MFKFLAALIIVLALAAVASAQRVPTSPSHSGVPTVGLDTVRSDPAPYSHSVTGKVLQVSTADHSLVVELRDSGPVKFIVDEKARKTADKKIELAGKKDLTFADYKPGQTVRVTYRIADNKVLEVRVKASPK